MNIFILQSYLNFESWDESFFLYVLQKDLFKIHVNQPEFDRESEVVHFFG